MLGILNLQQEGVTLSVLSHILKTPYCEALIGLLKLAARLRPSTRLVSAGSMTPSSHSLALAKAGSPSLSYLLGGIADVSLHQQNHALKQGW